MTNEGRLCPDCKVLNEPMQSNCALCGKQLQTASQGSTPPEKQNTSERENKPLQPEVIRSTAAMPKSVRNSVNFLRLEFLTILILSTSVILLTLDLVNSTKISWSVYPLLSLGLIYLLSFFPLVFFRKPFILVLGEALSVLAFLFLLDITDGRIDFFDLQGSVLILSVVILSSTLILFSIKTRKKEFTNISALLLFSLCILGLGVDLALSLFLEQEKLLSWSLYMAIPGFILAGLLLYFHYRLFPRINFHERVKW